MGGDLAGCRICSRFLVVLGRRPAVAKPLVATPRSRRPIRRFWVQTGELVSINTREVLNRHQASKKTGFAPRM